MKSHIVTKIWLESFFEALKGYQSLYAATDHHPTFNSFYHVIGKGTGGIFHVHRDNWAGQIPKIQEVHGLGIRVGLVMLDGFHDLSGTVQDTFFALHLAHKIPLYDLQTPEDSDD